LTGVQGARFGIKVIGGTGGDSGPALDGLRTIYYDPVAYDVLPYRHSYTQTKEEQLTGYFIPSFQVVNKEGYMDHRGFTPDEKGLEYYERERDKKAKDPKGLVIYSAEYCYNAEEAFALEGDNKFNKVLIAEQIAAIRIHKNAPKIQ